MVVNDENYVNIQGWMVNRLKLKGNELLAYAIIYGFSQDGSSEFNGSAQYIADWLNVSKRTAFSVLKSLVDKNLIARSERTVNNVILVSYKTSEGSSQVVKNLHGGGEKSSQGVVKVFHGGGESFSPNNKEDNIKDINKDNENIVSLIVESLNEEAGTSFRASSRDTRKHINARLAEGFTVDDFRAVIKTKTTEWKGTKMAVYLRPSTLFGTKFESYLQQKQSKASPVTADYNDVLPY